jgi:hypothetical protein
MCATRRCTLPGLAEAYLLASEIEQTTNLVSQSLKWWPTPRQLAQCGDW